MSSQSRTTEQAPQATDPMTSHAETNTAEEEKGRSHHDDVTAEAERADEKAGKEGHLPSTLDSIEALGIPDWQKLEKKLVRRLDWTLMPCLWVLYLFNYLDRASIA